MFSGTLLPEHLQQALQVDQAATQATVAALSQHPPSDLVMLQQMDPVIQEILGFWKQKQHPNKEEREHMCQLSLVLLRQWDRLVEKEGVLYRQIFRPDCADAVFQLLMPASLKTALLTEVHQGHGHQGVERTLELLRQRYYWPGMSTDVVQWCQACEQCQVAKGQPAASSFMGHLLASQ